MLFILLLQYETPSNSESGISSGEMTSSRSSSMSPKSSNLVDDEETSEILKDINIQAIEDQANDDQELWRVRGQLEPEPAPSSAYAVGTCIWGMYRTGIDSGERI